jgi:release factor glutamine methyltransferase
LPKTLQSLLSKLQNDFDAAGIDNPRQEAKWLIESVLNLSKSDFLDDIDLDDAQLAKVNEAAAKRAAGLPLSKIIGRKGFWQYEFITGEHVLDPRPDTEILIEEVFKFIDSDKGRAHDYRILDLGTGSGCIILTLLSELQNSTGVTVDISLQAIETAQKNAQKLEISADRLEFIHGSWLEPFAQISDEQRPRFDIIVSNPPYIPSQDIESLQVEVKNHDPILALDGGIDGMDAYNKIVKNLNLVSRPQTRIFFEIGTNQTDQISRIVSNYGFDVINVAKDLGGINRVVSMTLGAS